MRATRSLTQRKMLDPEKAFLMAARSAGILMYRLAPAGAEVLLVHPGGPFWSRRDLGAWSIPKGEIDPGETAEEAACREFGEELGATPAGPLVALGSIRQRAGKSVEAFAVEGDMEAERFFCATEVELEWPRGSGRIRRFPEIDRAAWFPLPEARLRLLAAQAALIDRLEAMLRDRDA